MAVEVTLNDVSSGKRKVEKHEEAVNYTVDQNGHLHVTGWERGGISSLAGYSAGTWYSVVVTTKTS